MLEYPSNLIKNIVLKIRQHQFFTALIFLFLISFFTLVCQINGQFGNNLSSESQFFNNSITADTINQNSTSDQNSDSVSNSNSANKNTNKKAAPSSNSSNSNSGTSDGSTPAPSGDTEESLSSTVAIYADSQSDTDEDDQNHQRAVNYILNTSGNPVFHAGDLMEDGTLESLNRFNNVTATLRATRTFYAAIGNNERNSSLYFDNFTFPNNERWYSVNSGNLHVIILDSVYSASDPSQLSWLASDLQSAASQSRITCVIYHYPTFSSTIESTLENYGADFVVAGHYHSYAHSINDGINYFVTTGQPSIGYFLVKTYSTRAVVYVYNSSNSLVDTITINNR